MNYYERMLKIRLVEDRLQVMCLRGDAGDLHFSKGQEAISVGVMDALSHTDYIVTHHRTIAHQLAKGAAFYPLIAEILGKATGVNGGKAGEMHISDSAIRHAFSFQLVGTCVPVAAGLAWAIKYYLKSKDRVVVFFGDAATSNGQIHEGLNIASLQKLPLLLVCENNGLAGNITPEYYLPTKTVSRRTSAYDIESVEVDGNDYDAVRAATEKALTYIDEHGRPYLLEMHTTRLCWHKQGQRDVRTKEKLEELSLRDPLLLAENRLGISPDHRKVLEHKLGIVLDQVFEKVLTDPLPKFVPHE